MIYLEFHKKKIDLVVINYVCEIKSVTAIINQFGEQTRILHLTSYTTKYIVSSFHIKLISLTYVRSQ